MPTHENYDTLIKLARKDLDLAKNSSTMENLYIEGICFHCQQCAEKSLKAFIIFHNIRYKFTHDLEKLCKDCIDIDKSFSSILNPCLILTYYSSDIRYLDDGLIFEKDMFEAIELADEGLEFVKAKCFLTIHDQNS